MNQTASQLFETYYPEEHDRHSRIAEWFILLVWIFLTLEGVFHIYFETELADKSAIWTRITPFKLFPSELLFYGPIFLITLLLILRGRAWGYKTTRGFFLLIVFLFIGIFQAIHGKLAGSYQNFWLSDFRQIFLMIIFTPLFNVLGQSIRTDILIRRFSTFCTFISLYTGVAGLLMITGTLERDSVIAPYYSGLLNMTLAYGALIINAMITGKLPKVKLVILAMGILAPLSKPAIAVFIFINMMAIWLCLRYGLRFGSDIFTRSFRTIFIMAVFLIIISGFVLTIGGGAAQDYLEKRFLKTEVSAVERDITTGRLAAWIWALEQFRDNPVLGTGLGFPKIVWTAERELRTIPVHNLPLTILYETGLIGSLICVVILFIWISRISRFFHTTQDIFLFSPMLGLYAWIATMMIATLLGRTLGVTNIGFLFWSCVGLLNNTEAQQHEFYRDQILNPGYDGLVYE